MSNKIVRKISNQPIVGIYQIINKINGKIYIGQSIDIERRWNQHRYGKGSIILRNAIKKYGVESFEFEVLETINYTTKNEVIETLTKLEQKWFDDKKPYLKENGYNINKSSKPNLPIVRPDGYGEIISKIKIDNNHCGKGVKQYNKNGEFIKEWKSAAQIERELGYHAENISACCLRKQKSSNGFIWRFSTDTITNEDIEKIKYRPKPIIKQIRQLTLNGVEVKIWGSYKELVLNSEFDNRPVKKCCLGERINYKGYKWEYV